MNNTESKELQELRRLVESHDKYYMYSDDNRVYKQGQKEKDRINALLNQLKGDEVEIGIKLVQ